MRKITQVKNDASTAAASTPAFACCELRSGERERRDQQRDGEADAGDRARAGDCRPADRRPQPSMRHRGHQPRREHDADRLAEYVADDDAQA